MRALLMLLIVVAPWGLADVYKTVDKDGRIIYTDKPQTENAQKIELRELNTVPGVQPVPQSTPIESLQTQPALASYKIDVISPRNDVIIPIGQRDLAIAIKIEPELQDGHLLVYFMDGELLEETASNNIIVKDVPRGTHTLAVEAIDANGQSLGTSAPVSVSIMRPVIKNPAPPVATPQ